MKLKEVVSILNGKVLSGEDQLELNVTSGYASDLLSDVMANAREGQLWFTLQTHPNVAAVALLLNLGAVIITGGNEPDPVTVEKAKSEKMVLVTTQYPTFEAIARLSKADFSGGVSG